MADPLAKLYWAVALDVAGLYVADSEADAIEMQQILEYEIGEACSVYQPTPQQRVDP